MTKPNWKAAFFGKCPACGKGGIFCEFIKLKPTCPSCELNLQQFETADGPAFFAISLVGTLAGIVAGIYEVVAEPPLYMHLVVGLPIIAVGSYFTIRISKTLMIAHQMKLKG
jgi:uncharacterized protein (DUF983 family)